MEVEDQLKSLQIGPASNEADFVEFKMAGITSHHLSTQLNIVKDRSIAWDTFFKANVISQAELDKILAFDKLISASSSPQSLITLPAEEFVSLVSMLALFMQKIVRVDTVQYLLFLMDTLVSSSFSRQDSVFGLVPEKQRAEIYTSVSRCLVKDDEFTQQLAAKVIGELLSAWDEIPSQILMDSVKWCVQQLSLLKPTNSCDIAVQLLQVFLRHPVYRSSVFEYRSLVPTLFDMLRKGSPTPQLTYQVIVCFWLLAFHELAAVDLQKKYDIVSLLTDVAKQAVKEKIVRICVATFRMLLEKVPDVATLPMVGNKVLALCDNFLGRKWSDEDIVDDLTFLKEHLTRAIVGLSSWDEYSSELRSGKLEWSPAHTSELFWKENAARLNERDHELLRTLARLLVTSTNPVVLAVACYDIGQYVKYYPKGKKFVQDLGAKQQIMELMTHKNAEVRYNALMTVQQYMANSWEF